MTKRQTIRRKILSSVLGTLLLTAAAPAAAQDLELMGALWVGESGGVLKINATDLNLDLEVPDPLGVSAIAVDTGRRTVWAFVQPNLLAFDFAGQQTLSVPIPTTGTTAHLVVRPSDGSVWLSVDTDLYNVSTGGSILTTTTLPDVPLEIDVYSSSVLWVATADAVTAHDAVTGAQIGSVDDLGSRPKIRDIAVFSSTLWVGLSAGPRRYTVNSSGTATFQRDFSINGLTHIDQAANDRAWAATSNDLVSIRLFPFNTGTTFHGDPFPGKEATIALVASGPDERVFIASDEGRIARMVVLGDPEYIQGLPPVAIRDLAAFPRETVPPNISITSPLENGWVTTLRPTIVISYSDSGSGVDPSTLSMTSGYDCTTSATGANCVRTSDLFEGSHSVFARVNDFAGNFSQQIQRFFFTDVTPPTISITSPVAGATIADPLVPIDVAYSDARSGIRTSSLAIQANGVDLPVSCSTGPSSATCTPLQELPFGPVALTASIEDIAGLTSVSAPVDITLSSGVDTTPPDLEIAGPLEGLLTPDPQPRIVLFYGDTESGVDTATLSLQKDGLELQRQCTFGTDRAHCALSAPLPEGPATLTATIADVAGNTSLVAMRSFTVIAPVTTVFGTVLDSGGAPAVGAEVAVPGAGTAVTASDGSFSIPAVPISAGQRLTVVARTGLGEGAQVAGARDLAPAADGTTDAGTLTLQPLCVPLLVGGFNDLTGVGVTGSSAADVYALHVYDDGTGTALYVGGIFNLAGGLTVSNLARFDGTTWSDVGGGVFGTVRAMEVFDDGTGPQLYVAGSFFQAGGSGGIPVSNIARWDGQAWNPVGAGTNATVHALEVYDDGTGPALYVGGDFTSAGGSTADHVARWDGLSWSEVGGGVNRFVTDLLVADLGSGPELVVGGDFSTAGGIAADDVAVWNGTSWAPLGAGPGASVRTLVLHDDGSGTALYSGSSQFVSRWDGLQWVSVGAASAPAAAAQVLLSHDDGAGPALYAGVSQVGGLLRWDGVSWSGVGGGITDIPVSPQIRTLASFDDLGLGFPASLFVGGRFNNAGGLPSEALAKWYRECGPIDRTPPRIDVTVPKPGSATSLTQVSFSGSLSEPAGLTFDGAPVTVDGSLGFTHGPVGLVAGLNSFELIATDAAGNVARLAAQIYQDGSPPEIAFRFPLAGETVDLARPRIELEHSDDLGIDPSSLELRLGGSPLGVDCETFVDRSRCRPLGDLPSGLVSLTATVRDRAGNLSPTASLGFTVAASDTLGTTTVTGRVQLPGGVPVAGARVEVLGRPGLSTLSAADGTFTLSGVEVLASETLTVTARLVNAGGGLFAVVSGVVPVLSGLTDAGTLELKPPCDLGFDSGFDVAVGVDAMYPRKAPDFSDTNLRPRIRAMEIFDDGTGPALYVAGEFLVAGGVPVRNIARWDGSAWSAVGTNVRGGGLNNRVQTLAVFDDGTGPALYAGGFFSSADGTAADNLAKWDGTAWTGVASISGSGVWALETFDDGGGTALFVGGNFWSVDGVSVANVARWDGTVWTPLAAGLGGSFDTVFTLAGEPGNGQTKLYAGGDFTHSGGTLMYRIAAWDGSSWSDLDLGVQTGSSGLTTVSSLAFFSGDLYVGGFFGDVGSGQLPSEGVARWTGRAWRATPGLDIGGFLLFGTSLGVQAFEVFDDGSGEALYALGSIRGSVTGISGVARWNGSSWSAVGEGVDADTWGGVALKAFDDDPSDGVPARLYAGAGFRFAEGYGANQIAAWDGQSWARLGEGLVETVEALTVTREHGREVLYAATAGTLSRWDGEELVQIPPPLLFTIETLALHDDGGGPALYAGGEFDTTGPWNTNGVVRWNGTSWEPLSDGLGFGARVFALSEYDDGNGPTLIAAGSFTTAGPNRALNVARWDGSSWSPLATGIDGGSVNALTVFDDGSGSSLIAGGFFDTAGGGPVNRIARWDGVRWSALGEGFSSTVLTLAVFDDGSGPALYAGGSFTTSGTTAVNGIARWDGSAWQPLGGGVNGNVTAMTVWDDGSGPALYVAGVFTSAGGVTANRMAKWDGSSWSAVGSDLDVQIIGKTGSCGICNLPTVGSLAAFDDGSGPALYVGGKLAHGTFGISKAFGFRQDGGEVEYLARLHRPLVCPVVDTVPPTLAFTQPEDSGVVTTDLPVIALSYSDSGSGVDTSTLSIDKDGVPLAVDCTVGAFAATCTPVQALAEGPVTLTATVADVAGNVSAPAQVSFTVSLGAPVIQFSSPLDGELLGTASPPIILTYTPNADPSTLVLQSQPVAVSFTCTPGATSASCTPDGPLAEGLDTLTATIEDGIGQLSAPATVQVTVDTLPPTLILTAPAEGSTVGSSQPQIELDYADAGAGIDTSSLSLLLDGTPLAATCNFLATGAQCVPDAPMADGPHTVAATVADLSGKVSAPDQVGFTVDTSDTVPPVLTVTSPVSGSVTTDPQTSFVGSLDEPGTLTLNGDPVTLDAADAFDHPVTLTEGWNRFILVATDLVGNQTQQEVRLLLDTTPPTLVILQPMDGSFFDPALDPVELRVGDSGAGVDAASLQLEANGLVHGATCTSCSTGITCTLDPLTDTVVTLVVTLLDLAGNTASGQALFTSDPNADITPPVLAVSLPQPGTVTSDDEVFFIGTVSEPATVTLDGAPVTLDADNAFQHGPVALVEGANAFTLLAVDAGANSDQVDLTVTRDSQAPAPVQAALVTVSGSTGGQVTVTGAAGAVSPVEPDLVVAAANTTLGVPVDLAVQPDGSFSGNVPGHGGNRLSLAVRDGADNHSEPRVFTVPGSPVPPPDPVTEAPSLDPTVFTDLCGATAFLWNGANPIQTGVAAGALDCERVAVVRGRVLDEAGLPLAGVSVAVHRRPDLGSTLSRTDGRYDLVVEAGPVVLHLATEGRLPVQRRVSAPRDAYVAVPDVVLLPLDSLSTPVDLTLATPVQVARGSVSTDLDGSRQATLFVLQGTSAQLRFPGGASAPITGLTVRATEYTVGARGPAAMPAELPPGTDYTYAVELSVDEALAAGAQSVELSQPVITLVENFLGFPAGTRVPAGYYDRDRARWIGAPDGRVIEILAINGGLADLDVDGTGTAADAAALAALGITDAERQQLAALYSVGQSLWRVPVEHFTPWDFNYWARFPAGAEAPEEEKPKGGDADKKDNPCESSGSIIECDNQILGESLSLAGIPYSLNYRSDRVPGRKVANDLDVSLGGAALPPGVKRIDLQVDVAGQSLVQSFPATPSQTFQFSWDGNDAYGRPVPGRQPYQARLGYVYDVEYQDPPDDCESCFGEGGDGPITGDPARLEGTLAQIFNGRLGAWDAKERLGLGGWSLDVHHFYDPFDKILYRGDGSRRRVDGIRITQVMSSVGIPHDLATEPDGTVHFFDGANQQIRRINPDGTLEIEAGDGNLLPAPGVPAQQARLPGLRDLAFGPDGRLYFLLDGGGLSQEDTQIWRIEADGTLTHVLGHPAAGGFPLVSTVFLTNPGSMTFDEFGDLYVSDEVLWPPLDPTDEFGKSIVIMKVNLGSGEVRPHVLGLLMVTTSFDLIFGEKGPLPPNFGTGLTLTQVGDLAFGPDGSLYFTVNSQGASLWRKFPDGPVVRLAGSCDGSPSFTCSGFNGDGQLGTSAYLNFPEGLVVLDDDTVVFADSGNHRIRAVDFSGYISTVAGTGQTDPANAGAPANRTNLAFPQDVDLANGDVVVSDTNHGQVQKVASPSPVVSVSEIRVPSEDGSVVFVFDAGGRHLRTEHARTGEILLTFGYGVFDNRALLVSITDVYGSTTQIERDALTGDPRALIGPFGQRTDLTLDSFGYLRTVSNPAGEVVELGYNPDGLLTSLKDPKLRTYTFEYDPDGRLTKDLDPAGGFTELSRVELTPNGDVLGGFEVTRTTALGRTSTHRTESLATGGTRTTVSDPAGVRSITVTSPEQTTQTAPDGTVAVLQEGPDPRFGVQEPQVTQVTVTTPGGLVSTTTTDRVVELVDPQGDPEDPANLAKITNTVNVNGRSMVSEHDLVQGLITTTSPEGRQSVTSLDSRGRVTRIDQPGLEPTVYAYDTLGRLETLAQGTRSVTYAYNPQGLLESVTDPASRTVGYGYDTAGRLTSQTLPDLRVIQFAYDANGNLTSITPPGRPVHQFDHTVVDLPESYTPPAAGLPTPSTTMTYNLDRQVELVTRPDGQTLDYVYEPATGRLQSVVVPRGTYSYAYDPVSGNPTSVTDPAGGSLGFGYDGALPTSVTWSGEVSGTVEWTYDNSFEVISTRVNGANEVTFSRDQDGLLTQAGALTLSRRADNGFLAGTTLGQATDSYSFDLFGEIETYSASFGATELYSTDFTPRDDLGRITQKVETIGGGTDTYGYTYDPVGRLTDVTKNGLAFAHYEYDANGNRTTWTDPWGSGTATYDDQDRLQTYGDLSFTFTDNGELLSKTDGTATVLYDYDVVGNLLGVTLADGIRIDYVLDASNRRVGKKIDGVLVEGFLYQDRINPIAELDGTGNVRTLFVYGSRPNVPDYMVRGGQTYRFVSDHLGSVRLVVDTGDGSVVQRIDYGPFGRILLDTNPGFQPFGFAGGLYDHQTGLVRFGARDYDPETGRWTTKDPIGFGSGTTNLYGYVLGDPINRFDPLGLYSWDDFLQDAANFSAGFGDTITFGLTRKIRQWMGTDHVVDPCAGFYKAGKVAGHVWQAAAVQVGATRGIQALRAARLRSSLPAKLYHYTDDATAQLIKNSQLGLPNKPLFLTPKGGLSPLRAQRTLALPRGNSAQTIFEVSTAGMDPALISRIGVVRGTSLFRGGGGLEVVYQGTIDLKYVTPIP